MEDKHKEFEAEASLTGVFDLPGEPAVLINGVPDISPSNNTVAQSDIASVAESPGDTGFGEWLEGREVKKLFGDSYYSGNVTQFDKETGWYRVEYEDGDFEDLDWHELQEVLLPLDISIPLKALALKITRKNQKPEHKLETKSPATSQTTPPSQNRTAKSTRSKGKKTDAASEVPVMELTSL